MSVLILLLIVFRSSGNEPAGSNSCGQSSSVFSRGIPEGVPSAASSSAVSMASSPDDRSTTAGSRRVSRCSRFRFQSFARKPLSTTAPPLAYSRRSCAAEVERRTPTSASLHREPFSGARSRIPWVSTKVDVLDEDYPINLRLVYNRPPFLFVRGVKGATTHVMLHAAAR